MTRPTLPSPEQQRLHYIADMLQELRDLVPAEAGQLLPYLLDMASIEAREAVAREFKAGE